MSAAPVITIFVRHSGDCKYTGDEFEKRCRCRKHLRWTHNGTQHRRKANTRTWAEAEQAKRELEDQLAGRVSETKEDGTRDISDAVDIFIADKKAQGVGADALYRYRIQLDRLLEFCRLNSVFVVQIITRELLTKFVGTWDDIYPSSMTRSKARERLRSFLRYCYEAKWIERIPQLPKIQVDEPETQPLTADEYRRLVDAVYSTIETTDNQQAKIRAFIQCMRWTGLSILDTITLERDALRFDEPKNLYRVVTQRQKMERKGTGHVSVPIPKDVAQELLAVVNDNPKYFFWSGNGQAVNSKRHWTDRVARLFDAAKIHTDGFMKSHRLRDTFAVDLLEKGVPMEEVSKLLGHSSIKTTEKHYAKWSKGRQDRLDSLVTGTWVTKGKLGRKPATDASRAT